MKHLIYLFFFLPVFLNAQQVFSFESGDLLDWIQCPQERWQSSNENAISGAFSLHHSFDNEVSGEDCIAFDLLQADTKEYLSVLFRIKYAYTPSSANNWQLYILSDEAVLEKNAGSEAMVFGINFDCSDDLLKLWQCGNGEKNIVLSTDFNYQNRVGIKEEAVFLVERFPNGEWNVSYYDEESDVMKDLGGGFEFSSLKGTFMGFRYAYSSAQDRKLWLDDVVVVGHFCKDTIVPAVCSASPVGLNVLKLEFEEGIVISDSSVFSWNGLYADSLFCNGSDVLLYFGERFPNRTRLEVRVENIADYSGNVLSDTLVAFFQDLPAFGDVVINEILQDPQPVVYLPAFEFIELFNRRNVSVCLTGWKVEVNGRFYEIDSLNVPAGEYVILTHEDGSRYFRDMAVKGLFTSMSLLTNDGGEISVFDQYGRMVHTMCYEALERYDAGKVDGGWSLEQIDPNNLCGGVENWGVSDYWKGGTPGCLNSIGAENSDNFEPVFQYLGMEDTVTLSLHMNEYVLLKEQESLSVSLNGRALMNSNSKPFASTSLSFELGEALSCENNVLSVDALFDCAGNKSAALELAFEVAEIADEGDLLINEIMFNPLDGRTEYVEFVNVSDKVIDMEELKLGLSDDFGNNIKSIMLSGYSHYVFPKDIIVVCQNARLLRSEWNLLWDVNVEEVSKWRNLPNDIAYLYVMNRSDKIIDYVHYSEEMHHDYIGDSRGVSLERILLKGMSADQTNWTSASYFSDYGTPGMINSQFELEGKKGEIFITPEVFSPDNDAVDDVLLISIPSSYKTGMINVFVSTLQGVLCRSIVRDGILGSSDTIIWDGEDDEGLVVQPGLYVIHIDIVCEGKRNKMTKVCGVRYR